jgi:preprotein translocase subunit SecD
MTISSRPGLIIAAIVWLSVTIFGFIFLFNVRKFINFGIDLVGGTYLILDVKIEEAVKNELMSASDMLVEELKQKKMTIPDAPIFDQISGKVNMKFDSNASAMAAKGLFKESYATRDGDSIQVLQEDKRLIFSLSNARLKELSEDTIESNIAILRTRLDQLGAGEINIAPQGERNIVVELPDVTDPEKAKARIGRSALLEMKPVYDHALTKEDLLEKIGGKEPVGTMIIPGKSGEKGFYLVPNFTKLTGRLLKDVFYDYREVDIFSKDGRKTPHTVNFKFNSEGAKLFYELTKNHLHEPIAIIIDNTVVSAPSVGDEPIEGGSAFISGAFEEQEAKELVSLLKSGAFAAPVDFIEERHIAPTLGQESIYKGLLSCVIGLALLLIFSILVYKVAGLYAFIVLLYNLLFILFGLALIPDATLTLPGIAGMVLTVGMAIDSSILIYERIKEELYAGISLNKAINSGFSGAMGVILDANITTFIIGAVLYYFGSPAIQGFALTMMLGIVSTLITGLVLLRWFFSFSFEIFGIRRISF